MVEIQKFFVPIKARRATQRPFWIQWRHIWNRENRQVLPVKACNHLDECLLWGSPDVPILFARIFWEWVVSEYLIDILTRYLVRCGVRSN